MKELMIAAWNVCLGGFILPIAPGVTLYLLVTAVRETARHLREL